MAEIHLKQILINGISNKLKSMEAGAFQNFCIRFLPLVDPKYEGLILFGGTPDGKTRKGTPDLIKTLDDGKQIAVQCSTEKTYWNLPKDKKKFPHWKPCVDIDKCLTSLVNVYEIILCSSQDIPTNAPNAESEIMSYAKSKTNAKITVLYGMKICNLLIDNIENPEIEVLYRRHFPEIYTLIESLREKEILKLSSELYKKKSISLKVAEEIAKKVVKNLIDIEKAKTYALKEVDLLKSRFERVNLPDPGKVTRRIPKDYPLFNPIGKISTLLGVPKIGKSSLASYFAARWDQNNIKTHWFDCPIENAEQKLFIEDLLRNIWSCFIAPDEATELSAGIIPPHSIVLEKLKYNLETPSIYVIDNAEHISDSIMKLLCEKLKYFKDHNLLSQIGILFISNKRLTPFCRVMLEEIFAPVWTEDEIKEFLSIKLPEATHYKSKKYLELLSGMSGGHPLVALALARRFPSVEQLLFSRFKGPDLADEDLTMEIKNFLFEDILKDDNDSLLFVLRLSVLTHRASDKIIHTVARKVNPPIAKPFNLVLDKLYGTIIEGDQRQGYSVSFVYKEVAKKKLNLKEQQEIYDAVSLELLKPKGSVLNAIEVTEGIFYALLAFNFERAFYWTVMLLQATINKRLSTIQIKTIIDRLELVTFINAPTDVKVLPLYYLMLLSMAMAYAQIEDYEKACKSLQKIEPLSKEIKDEKLKIILSVINEAAKIYRMFLVAKDDPLKSVRILSEIDLVEIQKYLPHGAMQIRKFFEALLSVVSIKQIPRDLLRRIIDYTDLNNKKAVANLMRIALNLGVKADNEKMNPDEVISLFPSDSFISELLQLTFNAQYALQKDNSEVAINFIDQAIALCKKQQLWDIPVENVISQLKGDACYKLGKPEAKNFYLRCIECLGDQIDSFDYAWANYRLGLLSENPKDAEEYFKNSSKTFELLGYDGLLARSEGERGISLVQLERPLEFVRIVEWMCRRYFLRNRAKFAPSITMAMAQLPRLICDIKGESTFKEGSRIYPKFERGVYARVLEIAKPQAGGTVAFYSLSRAYSLLKKFDRKIKCLRTALSFNPNSQIEKNSVPLIIHELLDEIIPHGEEKEIEELMVKGISLNPNDLNLHHGRDSKEFLSFCIFSKLDSVIINMNNGQRHKFLNILGKILKDISDIENIHSDWWLAAVWWRKARIGENYYHNKSEKYYVWKQAYDYGVISNNVEVIIHAGHTIGFFYCENYSIKSLADIHFNIVKSIPVQKEGSNRIEKIGQDLFRLWSKLDFRRLSEHDLDAKRALMDGAKILNNSGMPVEEAGPIMILLLFSIYQVTGEAVDWATEKVKALAIEEKIPRDIKERIIHYLQ